jgi:hypothetical protein
MLWIILAEETGGWWSIAAAAIAAGTAVGVILRFISNRATNDLEKQVNQEFIKVRHEMDQQCDRFTERFAKMDVDNERRDGRIRGQRSAIEALRQAIKKLVP